VKIHDVAYRIVKTFSCFVCGNVTTDRQALDAHIAEQHREYLADLFRQYPNQDVFVKPEQLLWYRQ
jgi:hypothetical protein